MRLAEVTQVVGRDEGHLFHNRLTHSLKVGQVARRIAERVLHIQSGLAEVVGVDPDVAEAAALAHDLGHPPFGHLAEDELNNLATQAGVSDGFEGNAQSLRIVTKLALRARQKPGLDLTRATLNAMLKYPWLRGGGPKADKWGAYESERAEFEWARESFADQSKSAEAEIMDWADDVTYAVHDMSDFFCAGLIPLDRLASRRDDSERRRFFEEVFRRDGQKLIGEFTRQDLEERFIQRVTLFPFDEPYSGTNQDRANVRNVNSALISTYVGALELHPPTSDDLGRVKIEADARKEVAMLKQLTWHYVILNPALTTQQHGKRRLIRALFLIFHRAAARGDYSVFPFAFREPLETCSTPRDRTRVVVDYVAGLTERQAHALYLKICGIAPGSALK